MKETFQTSRQIRPSPQRRVGNGEGLTHQEEPVEAGSIPLRERAGACILTPIIHSQWDLIGIGETQMGISGEYFPMAE